MSNKSNFCLTAFMALTICLALHAGAASVGPNGYTNDFSARPAATDFSTSGGVSGGSGDISSAADVNSLVQNLAASTITSQVTDSNQANPPTKLATAQWTSGGSAYLVTRPTGNAASVLMATLVNNTGTNCNVLEFSYQLTVGVSVSEEVPGQRLYYSFSTVSNSWTSLPAVSGINASRVVSASVPLNQVWANGAKLYLLWVDDNAADSTESAYEIDNFFASASYTNIPLSITLTAPANGQHFGLSTAISASVDLTGSPTNVSYYVDGNLATTRTSTPFTPVNLPAQALGTHTVYATASDADTNLVTTLTNAFVVDVALSGTLSSNTTLFAANSPYTISGNLTVPAGVMLTIEPGTTLQFAAGAGISVNGGQLIAAGTPDGRIHFTRQGTGGYWGGFSFVNARQSNVLAYVNVDYAGSASQTVYIKNSQVLIDRSAFLNNNQSTKWFDIWQPQVIIRHSTFGDLGSTYCCTAENMLADGWFIIDGNLFGKEIGDNDIFHLNRVSVKGGAAAVVINNFFTGSGDDIVDDNETDTHIEGNFISHANEGNAGNHGLSAGVTTGPGGSLGVANMLNQHLTVVRNVFYKNDVAIISKTGAYSQIYNNVFVANNAGVMFDEVDRSDAGPGRQSYIENCIFWNNKPDNSTNGALVDVVDPKAFDSGRLSKGQPQVTVNNCIISLQFHSLGTNNLAVDPKFVFPTNLTEINVNDYTNGFDGFDFDTFIITNRLVPDFHLQAGSPAMASGYNGVDMGIYVSTNAVIGGEPEAITLETNATLTVSGLDMYGYKYRLITQNQTNAWSLEIQQLKSIYQITLSGTTATAYVTNNGYANGDTIEILGADALASYFNGLFTITNVTANTFDYAVTRGTNAIINQTAPRDLWCVRPQKIELTGLTNGTYRAEAIRKNSQGVWQDANTPTVSKSWTVSLAEAARLSVPHFEGQDLVFELNPTSGQTYSVLYSDTLGNGAAWQKLMDIPVQPNSDTFRVTNAAPGSVTRFYRIITPAQP
jgi:hypothetical protein